MSLHTLANHLQSAGRGEDKVLVHMTPGEVSGLQSLAMAHGGSLTANPETGLPEAGFLSSVLPMIAGFALGPAGLGLTAMQAGLASAAIGTVATGSLKQGIMAGLGAYGGAGLGAGLMAQGAAPAVAPVGQNAAQTAITNAGNSAANFAGQGSNVFSTNPMFNSAAGTGGGFAGFQSGVSNVVPTTTAATPGMTSTILNQKPLYPSIDFATGMKSPGKMFSAADIAARNSQLAGQIPVNMKDPNAFVTTSVPEVSTNAYKQGILASNPAPQPWEVAAKMPRASLPTAIPRVDAVTTYPDLSTLKPGGSWAQTGTGRYTITNPGAANVTSAGRVIDATTTQPFAGGMTYTPSTSTAVDVSGQTIGSPFNDRMSQLGRGFEASTKDFEGLKGLYNAMPTGSVIASGVTLAEAMKPEALKEKKDEGLIRPYEFDYGSTGITGAPYAGSAERTYFNPVFTARTPYRAPGPEYAASGGLMGYAVGGAVEEMAAMNAVGANTGYPMANLQTPTYTNPAMQRPEATNVIAPSVDAGVGSFTGEARLARGGIPSLRPAPMNTKMAAIDAAMEKMQTKQGLQEIQSAAMNGDFAAQAALQRMQEKESMDELNNLGGYSDGGRLLKGPGDGVSDSIPASIGGRQPARLADGEFVVPARIVSELGNGSTEAGARKLYAMMDRVQKARRKTVGKGKVAVNSKAENMLPA
jgi:hypothetical protein